jgi:cytochrome b561
MKQVSRYHPLLATLHWVLAALIIAELILGFFGLAARPNSDPRIVGILQAHMLGGMLILVLMVFRFIVLMWTSRPADATTGHPLLDRLAPITHYGFYVLVLLMVGTGFATAIIAGRGEIVFGPSGAPLPPSLMIYPTFVAHALVATVLVGFLVLHIFAAFYHQFIRKDALFQRMFIGRRVSGAATPAE